ncbi:mycofactocin biosynthesis chaperone MftB [Nocardioides zeae]|uniref:Mycofactocin biosynthesis chaperone MftB n=1 Tax=Nocardioides imazamoxiresistens TaxID=3231893 RepID=A0ABU3Q1G6_9ACTN|nr:mycofactocin biosynthesis chaperone MftB [Nocardioides zeae]MDT9595291.1 mycofactocin biosynthesis chaperone MftB [Nocardioides zeae]
MSDAPTGTPTGTEPVTVALDEPWVLSPSVALRPEPFGALAYHFGNRKLTFLKRPELVRVVEALGEQPDVAAALAAAGVPETQWQAYAAALTGLARTDMIRPRHAGDDEGAAA